jgi:hypothetical protein
MMGRTWRSILACLFCALCVCNCNEKGFQPDSWNSMLEFGCKCDGHTNSMGEGGSCKLWMQTEVLHPNLDPFARKSQAPGVRPWCFTAPYPRCSKSHTTSMEQGHGWTYCNITVPPTPAPKPITQAHSMYKDEGKQQKSQFEQDTQLLTSRLFLQGQPHLRYLGETLIYTQKRI